MITFNNYNQKKRTKNINNLVYQKFIENIPEDELNTAVQDRIRYLSTQLVRLHLNNWDGIWIRIVSNFMLVARIKNVDIIDLSKNKKSTDIKLKKIEIFYGDFIYKNSALDMVSLLKKEISNVNPVIVQVNKKYRVKAKTINDINDFDIFFDKIVNTKFENYNISVD